MAQVRRGLKALGLSLIAALGLMSLAAAEAQAQWDVGGAQIAAHKAIGSGLKNPFLLLVPNSGVELECKTLLVDNGLLYTGSPPKAHATLLYSNCLTFLKKVHQPLCSPTILPVAVKINSVLHNGEVYLLAAPLTVGTNFTSIHFPGPCALPLTNITGSLLFECENGALVHRNCNFAAVNQLIKAASSALNTALGDELKYGLNPMVLDGEAEVFLNDGSAGNTFNPLGP